VLGVEAGADPLRVLQAAEEQAGADQRDERERDLRGHEHVAQAEQPVRPVGALVLSLSSTTRSGRDAWIAGARPKITPVATDTASVKSSTRMSGWRSIESAARNGGRNDQSSPCAQ
jgi:hypothetical protein